MLHKSIITLLLIASTAFAGNIFISQKIVIGGKIPVAPSGGGGNPISRVGSNFAGVSDGVTGSSRSLATPSNVTSGNSVIVCVCTGAGSLTFTTAMLVKSSGTATIGTVVLDAQYPNTSENLAIYRVPITGSGSLTFTFTPGGSSWYLGMSICEYAGISSFGTSAQNNGTSISESSGSITTSNPGMIVYIAAEGSVGNWSRTYSDTLVFNDANGATALTFVSQYKLITSSPNTLTSSTDTSSTPWWVLTATYQ